MLSTRPEPPAENLIPLRSVVDVNDRGYRHIIVELVVKGLSPSAIVEYMRREFGVDIPPQIIGHMIPKRDRESMVAEADALIRRRLKQMAIEEMEHLRNGFRAAELAENDDLMDHYAKMWQSWWDRVGKLYLPQELGPGVQATQINIALNTQVVREEVRNAEDAARILSRLDGAKVEVQSVARVERAEDAKGDEGAPPGW